MNLKQKILSLLKESEEEEDNLFKPRKIEDRKKNLDQIFLELTKKYNLSYLKDVYIVNSIYKKSRGITDVYLVRADNIREVDRHYIFSNSIITRVKKLLDNKSALMFFLEQLDQDDAVYVNFYYRELDYIYFDEFTN